MKIVKKKNVDLDLKYIHLKVEYDSLNEKYQMQAKAKAVLEQDLKEISEQVEKNRLSVNFEDM